MSDPNAAAPAARPTVAVIDDEPAIRKFLRASLDGEGYRVVEADTARAGTRLILEERPDLIVLDLGLPDRDGKEVVAELRGWSAVPVLVLSARDQEREKVAALDAGADDYLTKPFGVGELLARVRVALRHAARVSGQGGPAETALAAGDLRIDFLSRRVTRGGAEVGLTKLEFDLLATLARHAGKVLTHRFLLNKVWGPAAQPETHTLRVFVANLRKKVEPDPARPTLILTEQGVGYRFAEE